jgi:hypothetical protein
MAGSMCLAIMKTGHSKRFKYAIEQKNSALDMAQQQNMFMPVDQETSAPEAQEGDTTQASN